MKKKIYLLLFSLVSYALNAQYTDITYQTRNLGTNLSQAKQTACSSNASISGQSYRILAFFSNGQSPLETNKLYEFIDDNDNIKYVYITSYKIESFPDRDYYSQNRFTNINNLCEISRYHRLRSLGTSLSTSEINSFCSGSNFSDKPLAKWNIISENPLQNKKIYKIFVDDQLKYYWVEQSFSYATDDDGETVNEENITLQTITCPDSDNDGIPNAQDDCPNDYGTSENGCPDSDNDGLNDFDDDCPNRFGRDNGCPLPDFSVNSFSLTQENVDPNGNPPTFELNFCATIENTGDDDGRPRRVEIVLTTKNSIYNPGTIQTIATINNNTNINSNGGTSEYCFTHLSNFINPFFGQLRLSQFNYVWVIIDEGGPEEYSTENNDAFFSNSKTIITNKKSLIKYKIIDESLNNSNIDLKIYNLSGQLIRSTKISTKEDEDNVISDLPSGVYILKTPTKTKKIVK